MMMKAMETLAHAAHFLENTMSTRFYFQALLVVIGAVLLAVVVISLVFRLAVVEII